MKKQQQYTSIFPKRKRSLGEHLSAWEATRPKFSVPQNGFKVSPKQVKTLGEHLESRGFRKGALLKAFNQFMKKFWYDETQGKGPAQGAPSKNDDKSGAYTLIQDPKNANHNAIGMRPRTATEQTARKNM